VVSFENNTKASPAKEAGLLTGDLIVDFDGHPIQGIDDLHKLLTDERIGRSTPVTIIRGTQKLILNLIPHESK